MPAPAFRQSRGILSPFTKLFPFECKRQDAGSAKQVGDAHKRKGHSQHSYRKRKDIEPCRPGEIEVEQCVYGTCKPAGWTFQSC